MAAKAKELLESIMGKLETYDIGKTGGIFGQKAPVELEAYKVICPKPMCLPKIRCA